MSDKKDKVRISIDVTKEQHRIFKSWAALRGKSLAQLFLDAVFVAMRGVPEEAWLYEQKNKPALESLQRGLSQETENDWEAIKKRLKL